MAENNFQYLWKNSRMFRQIFLHNGTFKSVNNIDLGKAEVFWRNRDPDVDWDLCGIGGCKLLVEKGTPCKNHCKPGYMAAWKWHQGILYRYARTRVASVRGREYRAVHTDLAERVFGEIPDGYRVFYFDRNPFNLRSNNLILLSKVAIAAVQAGALSAIDAVGMDEVLSRYLVGKIGKGRPCLQWGYNVRSISMAAQIGDARVRQEISRKNLDPGNLRSIARFVHKHGIDK